jgi:hypothetical protein
VVVKSSIANSVSRPALSDQTIEPYEIRALGAPSGGDLTNPSAGNGFLRLSAGGGVSTGSYLSFIDLSGYSTVGDMKQNIVFGTSKSERMRINADGNVGIGTTNPECLLHLSSDTGRSSIVPTKLKIHTTSVGSDWNNSTPWGLIEFDTNDSSSAGTGPVAGIGARCESASGGNATLCFYTVGNNDSDTALNSASERMCINHDGNVGIGTTNPFCRLEIYGSENGTASGSNDRAYFAYDTGTSLKNDSGTSSGVSVWSRGWIGTSKGFIATNATTFSDERLKKNIVDADDGECLDILRQLRPTKYNYVDVVQRGETPVWGFIAQEVEAILPNSTHKFQEYIPNIYELANVSSSNVITFTNFNTSNLEANATIIRVKTVNGGQENVTLTEVIDEHTIRVEEDLNDWTGSVDETGNVVTGNQLFIFGQRMEDVRGLKKDAIWTVATAALQEVDRQLQSEKAKVSTLETQLASVLTRLDALESA